MGSTELVRAAARGELPEWARVSPERREHVERVAGMMERWSVELGLPEAERERWLAAAWLHDSLRDADSRELLALVPEADRGLHPLLLHGPAAAARLEDVPDPALLAAIRYHTVGHPGLDRMGKALYLADFLEPGRPFEREPRAALARRMPHELDAVLVEAVAARIRHLLDIRVPIPPETAAFWSSLVAGRR